MLESAAAGIAGSDAQEDMFRVFSEIDDLDADRAPVGGDRGHDCRIGLRDEVVYVRGESGHEGAPFRCGMGAPDCPGAETCAGELGLAGGVVTARGFPK
ncbi:hypothetical protein ARZXY2_4692 (plasmid) [Arthrobacter sp. ZXY-2]|nr:hypothetical protein ARZXY2_4692 [Arthrobacter sp. ZXY-2]